MSYQSSVLDLEYDTMRRRASWPLGNLAVPVVIDCRLLAKGNRWAFGVLRGVLQLVGKARMDLRPYY